jgi:diaminopimelate epimerase
MHIQFSKYQGTGNDFIIIDNRENNIHLSSQKIANLCDRKFGIGADGLMLLEKENRYDFKMVYFNADGNESSMCGNGGRCLTQFARDKGIEKERYIFNAIDGEHEAFYNEGWVHLKMKDVDEIIEHNGAVEINTGSPHYVLFVNEVEAIDVFEEGKKIRYNNHFKSNGINVNFVEQIDEDEIFVRTYERGVENETLSCGTGVTACALAFAHNERGFNRIDVQTKGGLLAVEFDKIGDTLFNNIWLCGPATFVFEGEINV